MDDSQPLLEDERNFSLDGSKANEQPKDISK